MSICLSGEAIELRPGNEKQPIQREERCSVPQTTAATGPEEDALKALKEDRCDELTGKDERGRGCSWRKRQGSDHEDLARYAAESGQRKMRTERCPLVWQP